MKNRTNDLTEGPIIGPLMRFVIPVLLALFLQSMYGAVDLLIVGKFAESADVSAVSTGSQMMMTITNVITSLAMGTTIFIGNLIGEKNREKAGDVMGTSIVLFLLLGCVLTIMIPLSSRLITQSMNAPEEAFDRTVSYLRICGAGSLIIISYNLIGSIFRGMGDSRTPLITVAIACGFNIIGDLLLVAVFHMGTAGAALATVAAQCVSVIASVMLIRRQTLPFDFSREKIRLQSSIVHRILSLGFPIALQQLLVDLSFLIVLAIVNNISLAASAGVGVAEKVCGFIMLIPIAFMQAMAVFVAQNMGAGKYSRAKTSLVYTILVSTLFGIVMFFLNFWHGDLLAGIFSNDTSVILAAADYLKAYAIDCLLTCFLFCFVGFYNGLGMTRFVMCEGLVGAFCVRVPIAFLMSRWEPVSLFHIGLGTPCATVAQIALCLCALVYANRRFHDLH